MVEFDAGDVERLARDLGTAGERAVQRTRVVVAKTGHDTVREAQRRAPVDTGHLRSSIGVDIDPDGLGFEAGPTASYGHFLEFGTSRMSPRPYLLPAFDLQLPAAVAALERVAAGMLRP